MELCEKYGNILSRPEFDRSLLKFDTEPYFSEYLKYGEEMVEDFVKFSGINTANISHQPKEDEELKAIMRLPIYRGYLEAEEGKVYVDAYQYEGEICSKEELIPKIKETHPDVVFCIETMIEVPGEREGYFQTEDSYEIESEPFEVGIADLFYYKEGPDGKWDVYLDSEEEPERDL